MGDDGLQERTMKSLPQIYSCSMENSSWACLGYNYPTPGPIYYFYPSAPQDHAS